MSIADVKFTVERDQDFLTCCDYGMFLHVRNSYCGGLGNVRRCQNSLVCTDNSEYWRSSIKYEYSRSEVFCPKRSEFS